MRLAQVIIALAFAAGVTLSPVWCCCATAATTAAPTHACCTTNDAPASPATPRETSCPHGDACGVAPAPVDPPVSLQVFPAPLVFTLLADAQPAPTLLPPATQPFLADLPPPARDGDSLVARHTQLTI